MYKLRFLICSFSFAFFCIAFVCSAKATSNAAWNNALITLAPDTTRISQKTQDKKEQTDKQNPAKKPDIATVPKARKQSRPKVVTPKANVKPIKVIRPKIKRP